MYRLNMGKLSGKVAIITGSSSGIGKATALLFAQEGALVTIHGRSTESLKKTVDLLKFNGVPDSRILVVQGLIEQEKTCQDLVNKTLEKFGRIDVLVNNAAMGSKPGVERFDIENYNYLFDVNLKSVVILTSLAIPHLEKTKGNIVNISSVAGIRGHDFFTFYSMAKAALDHYGRCYSVPLAAKGIRINTLNPGGVVTEFGQKQGLTPEQDKIMEQIACDTLIPMKRYAQPEEIAKAILFLAVDATYITGANLVADGGTLNCTPLPKFQ